MITSLITVEELKEVFGEILLNKTDKVTKISDGSALNAIAFGNSKNAQKIIKDVAILESLLFPDGGFGDSLDEYARINGYGGRFGARKSSTYVRVVADEGTTYVPNVHVFNSNSGVKFDVEVNYTVGAFGYGYVKVRAQTTGTSTNIPALSISRVENQPVGHNYCVNEYAAQYGSDAETDDEFRKRLLDNPNNGARGTLALLEQAFIKVNENILKIYYSGMNTNSQIVIRVLTENGIALNDVELNDILLKAEKIFSLTEMRPVSFNGYGISLQNVDYQPIDISMRLDLDQSFDPDEVRKNIQVRLNKYIDYRYWKVGQRVEWDNLLEIVKNTDGVKYVNDAFFYPNNDVAVDVYKLPRIRGFQMLDLNGNIIKDFQGILNPVYYPNDIDYKFQSTVLRTI